jgi:hypothetical protein
VCLVTGRYALIELAKHDVTDSVNVFRMGQEKVGIVVDP